jgi:hypothetical protein
MSHWSNEGKKISFWQSWFFWRSIKTRGRQQVVPFVIPLSKFAFFQHLIEGEGKGRECPHKADDSAYTANISRQSALLIATVSIRQMLERGNHDE